MIKNLKFQSSYSMLIFIMLCVIFTSHCVFSGVSYSENVCKINRFNVVNKNSKPESIFYWEMMNIKNEYTVNIIYSNSLDNIQSKTEFNKINVNYDREYYIVKNLDYSTTYFFQLVVYDSNSSIVTESEILQIKTSDKEGNTNISDLSDLPSDSWLDLNPLLSPGITTQTFLAHDPQTQKLYVWGGHPYGGGFPQPDEIFVYDLDERSTWKIAPVDKDSDKPISGCCSDGAVFDPSNRVIIKRGQHYTDQYEYYRKRNLEPWPNSIWQYNPEQNQWNNMRPFGYGGTSDDGPAGAYHSFLNYYILVDNRNNVSYRTKLYDAYSNSIKNIPVNDWNGNSKWTMLGGTRSDGCIVFDTKRKCFYFLGGLRWYGEHKVYYDIWRFDNNSFEWHPIENVDNAVFKQVVPDGHVSSMAAAYDSCADKVILFSGVSPQPGSNSNDMREASLVTALAYDPAKKKWSRLQDKPGVFQGHRPMDLNAIYSRKYNVTILLDAGHPDYGDMSTQTWAYRHSNESNSTEKPLPIEEFNISYVDQNVELDWVSSDKDVNKFKIYRSNNQLPWNASFKLITEVSSSKNSFIDGSIFPDNTYYYYITYINSENKESQRSKIVRTQPRCPCKGHATVIDKNTVKISWEKRNENVKGYNIYRTESNFQVYPINETINAQGEIDKYSKPTIEKISTNKVEDYVKINNDLISDNFYYDDLSLQADNATSNYPFKVYKYRVRAVNELDIESGWSPYWTTLPSPPTGVIVQQEDNGYSIQWRMPGNENKLFNYNLYMSYSPSNVVKINSTPINSASFFVENQELGNSNYQRFFVTAIDTLGQEGIPSAGSWGNRPYGEKYSQYDYSFNNNYKLLPPDNLKIFD